MQEKNLVHGAAPPLTAVERFLYGQKNDGFCFKKQEHSIGGPMLETMGETEIRNVKENMMFGPRKDKHLTSDGGNRNVTGEMIMNGKTRDYQKSATCKETTKKQPHKYLIKGQWTAEEDRYTNVYM